ncbi:ATPase, V1/A1 complex, subunit E [Piptocephalis cylindrospora]|uniref:ATPase, V1/A1 complex, subunit E n=1 Tax=Piptocephalis cylindrospora TaxID=1907219 RepID=A0A4V1IYM7_9FUNG|nr:ATPase, V1/A1 complex, subunit E [Piptocephalis cylindrospora]|eukprot:RKP15099.1 ATPase, V1/A1 complex, subunit E [Piptocephalis cylindrospora]
MSTPARALNDEEVYSEMKKMVAFIKQEALEKAREIKVKADEEFSIEKAKLVRQESTNIEANAQRRVKQAEIQRKINQSHQVNKARLSILEEREQLLQTLFEKTTGELKKVTSNEKAYRTLLRDLLLQSFYALMEEEVVVQCRQEDKPLVEGAITEAKKLYTAALNRTVAATIDTKNPLPSSSAGGVIVTAYYGRITCQNTLDSRLDLLKDQLLPEIRVLLYGHSPSRRFFN